MEVSEKHSILKQQETIRSLSVALTNCLNELEVEHDIDMYDEIADYMKEKRI